MSTNSGRRRHGGRGVRVCAHKLNPKWIFASLVCVCTRVREQIYSLIMMDTNVVVYHERVCVRVRINVFFAYYNDMCEKHA